MSCLDICYDPLRRYDLFFFLFSSGSSCPTSIFPFTLLMVANLYTDIFLSRFLVVYFNLSSTSPADILWRIFLFFHTFPHVFVIMILRP